MVSSDDIAHKKKSRWNTLRVSVGYRRWRGAPDHPRGTGGAFHCAGVCESHRSGKWWSFAEPLVLQRGEGECARVVTTHSPLRAGRHWGTGWSNPLSTSKSVLWTRSPSVAVNRCMIIRDLATDLKADQGRESPPGRVIDPPLQPSKMW